MDLGVLCLGFLGLGIFNVLEAALAYKLRLGYKPLPMETEAFWLAAVWAGVGLTILLYATAGLHWLGVAAGAPPQFTRVIAGAIYVIAGIALFMWAFTLDDLMQGFSVFLMHHIFPALVAIVLAMAFGSLTYWWQKITS